MKTAIAVRKLLTITLVFLCFLPKRAISENVRAKRADDFVESMGITTKFGFCPSNYCDNYQEVKRLLSQLGIRYIRDVPFPEEWRIRKDLFKEHGIQMLAEMFRSSEERLDPQSIPQRLENVKLWGDMVVGIVGANEYDNPTFQICDEANKCKHNWTENNWHKNYRAFQKRLYREVNADPQLSHLPVVLGPMAHLDNLEKVGNLDGACDKGNDHSYPGAWGLPSRESGWGTRRSTRTLNEVVSKVRKVCPGKKLWITETGYEEEIESKRNKYFVSRQAKAKYLPRIYANYFKQGQIEKTFVFELLKTIGNTRTGFGILDPNLKPTPAYYAIRNAIALLEEARWNRSRQAWKYPKFKTDFLNFTLKGNTKKIEHLLLQKSDGTFYLLLWQEVYVYNNRTMKNIVNANIPLTLQINNKAVDANTYLLYDKNNPAARLTPIQKWTNVSQLSLSIPDHILVVELKTANPSDIEINISQNLPKLSLTNGN